MACPVTKSLDRALDKAWILLAKQGHLLLNRPSYEDTTGASADLGEGLLACLTGIVIQGVKVTKGISLISIEVSNRVVHAHSLFFVSAGDYAEPDLWVVLGPLLD